ncbi:response regulator transcription factor [Pseudorhodoferax sp.]|uniref:response regulator transcription factor n=1 Tax=Pseudorhodoferax sp. TaxID=1993553 RepID=UPI002DD6AD5C|nr:response regulator transcription factor [Pseudorhodoferax sp.]
MAAGLSIVVVEDHDLLREATVATLCAHGHHAVGLVCAEDVDTLAGAALPDLFVIDVGLPGEDGFGLAQRLRAARPAVGIVMTTARTRIGDRVAGYGSGADIYLPKPVDPAELLAAVHALGQRLRLADPAAGQLRLDVQQQLLHGAGGTVPLTHAEALLLAALAQAAARTLDRWQVAVHLGLDRRLADRSSLDVRVSQLRRKLLQAGAPRPAVQAIRGHGYRLGVPVSVA